MLPMVKDVAEFRAANVIYDRLLSEIPPQQRATDVQLGVMIEVPSSALLAPTLAADPPAWKVDRFAGQERVDLARQISVGDPADDLAGPQPDLRIG